MTDQPRLLRVTDSMTEAVIEWHEGKIWLRVPKPFECESLEHARQIVGYLMDLVNAAETIWAEEPPDAMDEPQGSA